MAKRTIGKPRFYADMFQYLRAKGYYYGGGLAGGTVQDHENEVWNMNPYQVNEYSSESKNSFK